MHKLTLGFSPCPNDTFIFDAMVNGKIDTGDLVFDYKLEDVETLNQWAFEGKLGITKLSYNSFLHLSDQYTLLDSGSALGKGVGPLLICKGDAPQPDDLTAFLQDAKIAIPGKNTTANLLFSLAFPSAAHKTEVLFSDIESRVLSGEFDCGLVIHESRFTYEQRGLQKLIDLGDWWEKETDSAIPLGGICIRKDVPISIAKKVESLIKESLEYSWSQYPTLSSFVTEHAQEMEEDVMRQHINLYVNDYSLSLGVTGKNAVSTLFTKAAANGLIAKIPNDIYL